jgi:hypothetical protein
MKRWAMFCVLAAISVSAATLWASGPVGCYAIVEKVIFEPSEASPETIQVWGVFALTGVNGSGYSTPQRGYLYYKVDRATSGAERASLAAWADLKKVAGTGEAIGFAGGFNSPNWQTVNNTGRIRNATEKPSRPDVFPVGNPVVPLRAGQAEVTAKLKDALNAR